MNRRQIKARQKKTQTNYDLMFYELDERYKNYKSKKKARTNLEKQYQRLSKLADRRLRDLEKLSTQKGYENIKSFAYRKAMIDIKNAFGENATRFNRSIKNLSERQIEGRINNILEFLNSPSSTKTGIKKVWSNRERVITEKYGLSWDKALDVFERGIIKKYENILNSDLILKVIASAEKDKKAFDSFMKEATAKDYRSRKNPESIINYIANTKEKGILSEESLLNYVNE